MSAVACPYCGGAANFIASSESLYAGRDYGAAYVCWPCNAYVGVHRGTTKAKGTLANAELRALRRDVHKLFDPLWVLYWQAYPGDETRNPRMRAVQRARAYAWFADAMGIPDAECHIAMFGPERCREAIRILTERAPTPAFVRQWAKSTTETA